jgi:hypothetical protein
MSLGATASPGLILAGERGIRNHAHARILAGWARANAAKYPTEAPEPSERNRRTAMAAAIWVPRLFC